MTATPDKIHVPANLSPASRRWFRETAENFILDQHHIKLLELAARTWDRAEEARKLLKADGLTFTDRYGQLKPHPAVAIERDSQLRFARLIRELRLDDEMPDAEYSRPPRIGRSA